MDFTEKYLKYKNKYLELKKILQRGGGKINSEFLNKKLLMNDSEVKTFMIKSQYHIPDGNCENAPSSLDIYKDYIFNIRFQYSDRGAIGNSWYHVIISLKENGRISWPPSEAERIEPFSRIVNNDTDFVSVKSPVNNTPYEENIVDRIQREHRERMEAAKNKFDRMTPLERNQWDLEWKQKKEKFLEENKHLFPRIKERLKAENIENTKNFISRISDRIKSIEKNLSVCESGKITEPQSIAYWNSCIENQKKDLELNNRFLQLARINGVINGGYSKVVISWDGLGLSKSEYSEPEEIITYDMVLNEKRKLEEWI